MKDQDQSCRLEQFASPEVPVETIESWFIQPPTRGLDEIVGNEELKKQLRLEIAYIQNDLVNQWLHSVSTYVFYGLPGTGKTYLAGAFARELQEKDGFKVMRLDGSDIHCSLVGVAEKKISAAFRAAVAQAPCVLWIDDLDDICLDRDAKAEGYQKRLTVAFLNGFCHMRDSGKKVVLLCTTNRPEAVDGALMNKVKVLKVSLPDQVYRTHYFASKCEKIMPETGFTPEEMAAATEQFSYRDLDRLWLSIVVQLKKACESCAEGEPDGKTSDEAAIRALQDGSVRLTREMFRQGLKDAPPSDKTWLLEQQREYEEKYDL